MKMGLCELGSDFAKIYIKELENAETKQALNCDKHVSNCYVFNVIEYVEN